MRIQGQSLLGGLAPANYSSGWADYIAEEVERCAGGITWRQRRVNMCKGAAIKQLWFLTGGNSDE
jgi:hypothetical protein